MSESEPTGEVVSLHDQLLAGPVDMYLMEEDFLEGVAVAAVAGVQAGVGEIKRLKRHGRGNINRRT